VGEEDKPTTIKNARHGGQRSSFTRVEKTGRGKKDKMERPRVKGRGGRWNMGGCAGNLIRHRKGQRGDTWEQVRTARYCESAVGKGDSSHGALGMARPPGNKNLARIDALFENTWLAEWNGILH